LPQAPVSPRLPPRPQLQPTGESAVFVDSSSDVERSEQQPPAVLLLGLGVGVFATATSVIGLVWRIDLGSLLIAGLIAIAPVLFACRQFRFRSAVTPGTIALLIPLLPVLAWAAFVPPYNWDEVAYGVALPRDYARAGHFFYNDDYGPYSAFPGNYEALTTAALVLFQSASAMKCLNLLLAIGLAAIAALFCQELRAPKLCWPLAAALVLSAPVVSAIVPMVKNDVANAFFQCLAILACIRYLAVEMRLSLALAGMFLGIAVGIKYSGLQFAVCLGACLAIFVACAHSPARKKWGDIGIFALSVVLWACPWYARNLILFHNPLFPFYNDLLHANNAFGPEQSALLKESFGGAANTSLARGDLSAFAWRYLHGFGYFPVLLFLPGLASALMVDRSRQALFLACITLSYWAMSFALGLWEPRYSLSLLVLSAVFTAVLPIKVIDSFGDGRAVAALRVAIVAVTAVGLVAIGTARQIKAYRSVLTDWASLDSIEFNRRHVAFWEVADWLNHHLSANDKVGIGVNVQPFLYLDRPYFHIHPISEKGNLQSQATPDDFMHAFGALGLTMLAIFPWDPETEGYGSAANPHYHEFVTRLYRAVASLHRRGSLELVTVVDGVFVFRILNPDQ
jgi:hypothetical protein